LGDLRLDFVPTTSSSVVRQHPSAASADGTISARLAPLEFHFSIKIY